MSVAKAFPPALREIRFLFSQTGVSSAGTRQLVQSRYPDMKKYNPDLPILVREATGTPARVFARFAHGVERHELLDNLSPAEVEAKVATLIQSK